MNPFLVVYVRLLWTLVGVMATTALYEGGFSLALGFVFAILAAAVVFWEHILAGERRDS